MLEPIQGHTVGLTRELNEGLLKITWALEWLRTIKRSDSSIYSNIYIELKKKKKKVLINDLD